MFYPNDFLVDKYLEILKNLDPSIIQTHLNSKEYNTYFDFYLVTPEYVIVPKDINFVLKYFYLIKKNAPDYFKKLMTSWEKLIPQTLWNLDQYEKDIEIVNNKFDNIIEKDLFKILPPILKTDQHFIYYKNIINYPKLKLNIKTAAKFKSIYKNVLEVNTGNNINNEPIYIFNTNNINLYREFDGIKLAIPKWDSFHWCIEMPKYIFDKNTGEIVSFEKRDSNDQKIIKLINGLK